MRSLPDTSTHEQRHEQYPPLSSIADHQIRHYAQIERAPSLVNGDAILLFIKGLYR